MVSNSKLALIIAVASSIGIWLSFSAFSQALLGRLQWSIQASLWDNVVTIGFSVGFGVHAGLLTYILRLKQCARRLGSLSGTGFLGSFLALIAYPLNLFTCCGPVALSLSYILGGYLYLYQYQKEFALAGFSVMLLGLAFQLRTLRRLNPASRKPCQSGE